MRNERFSEEELKEASGIVRQAMLGSLPPRDECRHAFSEQFEQKMTPLILRARRRQKARKIAAKVAIIFLALLLVTGTFLATNKEARAKITQLMTSSFYTQSNDHIHSYQRPGPVSDEPLPYYIPRYLPNGLVPEWTNILDRMGNHIMYRSKKDEHYCLIFSYSRNPGWNVITMADGVEPISVTINGMRGDLYIDPGGGEAVIWFDEEQGITFVLDAKMNGDSLTLLRIARSVSRGGKSIWTNPKYLRTCRQVQY